MWTIKGQSMPYEKYGIQSRLENCIYKLYYKRSIITDQSTHNNRPDTVILGRTIEEVYLTYVAIPNTYLTTFAAPSPRSFRSVQT